MIAFPPTTISKFHSGTDTLLRPLNESLAIIPNPVEEIGNRLSSNLRASAVEHIFYLCSQPSSPSVFGGGRDGLWLIVRLFGGARTDYARQGKDRTDDRGLYSCAWAHGTSQVEIMRHHSCSPRQSPAVLTHARPSPIVPRRPHLSPAVPHSPLPSSPMPSRPPPSPTVLTHHRPSSIVPGRPPPLPCTNMSHPVGPAVLPKDGRPSLRADGTVYSLPSRPVRGSWQSPSRAPRGPRTVENTVFYGGVEGKLLIDKPGPVGKFFDSIVPSLHYLVD